MWLACESDVKLQSYASYKNVTCGGLIYYLTSCFEWCFKQGNALLLFFFLRMSSFSFKNAFVFEPTFMVVYFTFGFGFFFRLGYVGFWERFV